MIGVRRKRDDNPWARILGRRGIASSGSADDDEQRVREYFAGPTPPLGYKRGDGGDFAIPLVCQGCGANVADGAVMLHNNWHDLLARP